MTPEDRFERIEHILERLTESQVRTGAEVTKQNEGIRTLTVVSRTVLDSIQEMRATNREDHQTFMKHMEELREAQTATHEKLNILIDTVDKIIRRDNGRKAD